MGKQSYQRRIVCNLLRVKCVESADVEQFQTYCVGSFTNFWHSKKLREEYKKEYSMAQVRFSHYGM